jgi:LuxR family transcriptional regulator, maltose regulon positive regulatory protein
MARPSKRPAVGRSGGSLASRSASLTPLPAMLPGRRTHVVRPRLPSDHIARPRLMQLLDRGLERRLTLVSAPGGFGKTTLLSAWYPTESIVTWLSLDELHDDLRTFGLELIGAIQSVMPRALSTVPILLTLADLPPAEILASRLADELAELSRRIVIILDDYHAIFNRSIHAFLNRFIERIAPNVHLVILTRETPPLPIGRLRARGELSEIHLEQLAFTVEEGHSFFDNSPIEVAEDVTVQRMIERAEGWAAGLRLAALAMTHTGDAGVAPDMIAMEARGYRYARDFLIDDIVAAQPPELQEVLLRSAILENFCAPLLDALDAAPDRPSRGGEWIEAMKRANLFITVVDAGGDWCRFHQLFKDALRRKLLVQSSTEAVATLHRRASAWFVSQGLIEEAIRHALSAGDAWQAALLVEENFHPLLDREDDPSRLEAWIRLLPSDVADHCPAILLARAWLARQRSRLADIPGLLRAAETLLEQDASRGEAEREALRGTADVLWGYFSNARLDSQSMLESSERAIRRVPARWRAVRGEAEFLHASALAMVDREPDGLRFIESCRAAVIPGDAPRLARVLAAEARLHFLSLRSRDQARAANEILTLSLADRQTYASESGRLYAGLASYVSNELDEARDHFLVGQAQPIGVALAFSLDNVLGLALTWQALGEDLKAQDEVRKMSMLVDDLGSGGARQLLQSFRARLALARGDDDEAGRQLRLLRDDGSLVLPSFIEVTGITRARWLLRQGAEASLREAANIADGLHRTARVRQSSLSRIRADIVQALVHQARGDIAGALGVLDTVVTLTRQGDALRHLVDFGAPMQGLIVEMIRLASAPDPYLTRVLAAFPPMTIPTMSAAPSRRSGEMPLVDALTWREQEILALLDARLSNKEIARSLHISAETVKKHTTNIYQKLQVGSRREAVSRAYSLGLLHVTRESMST